VRYSAYARYKPSGVEWLGRIPEHWQATRLKYVASLNDEVLPESTPPDFELSYVDISSVDASAGIITAEEMAFETAPSRARRLVRDGDTIISTVRTYLRAIAPIRAPKGNLVVSTGFAVVRPRNADPGFMAYALRESRFIESVVARSVGVTYPATNASDVGGISVPAPPLPEQRAIAAFLDREVTKLDALVAKRRALVERLKEKRGALISRTVTRGLPPAAARAAGLDPCPRFKPSGIEWVGEVPEHWDLMRFKRLCTRVDVGIAEAATHAYCDDGVPIIRSTNVRANALDTEEILSIEPWFAERNRSKTLHAGDLVTVRTGSPGTTAVIPEEYEGSQCFTLVMSTLKPTECPFFFSYFMNADAGVNHFRAQGWGAAQTNISVPIVQQMPVLRPPLCEQRAIVDFLSRETAVLDRTVAKVEDAVARLQEYRIALVAAVVTGKVDVRGCSAVVAAGASTEPGPGAST
jgi:type I restriction enzyme, S subunit